MIIFFFKVDLARLVLSLELIGDEEDSYAVYADFDMKPISKEDLFDKKTQYQLNKYGLIFTKGLENGFHIIGNKNRIMKKALQEKVINKSLYRAKDAIFIDKNTSNISALVYNNIYCKLKKEYKAQSGENLTRIPQKKVDLPRSRCCFNNNVYNSYFFKN